MANLPLAENTRIIFTPDNPENSYFFEYIKNEGTKGVITKGVNEHLPRAMIFWDSFFY